MKFFVSSSSIENAKSKVTESLSGICGISYTYINVEKYWKIENVYIAEIDIASLFNKIDVLLDNYSDNWLTFGNPVDEYLASDHNAKARYMRKDFLMVQLFL